MSKLSFRARALDASKPMPIYMAEEVPDLPEYSAINRAVPQMPSGMEKEEESEHHLQRAICAGLIIPTPEVQDMADAEAYDRIYPATYKAPRQLIHMQPFTMEQDIPDYDMDSEDERWINAQSKKLELTPLKFEEMLDRLEKGSGQSVVTLQEAKSLLKEDDDLIIAVYDYWLEKRLKTQRPLIPTVKTELRAGAAANNPYLAFRRRTEKMQTRKNRKNDETSYEKMLKLRRDLSRAVTLLEMVKRREKTKREMLFLTVEVYEKRYQAGDFSGQMLSEVSTLKSYQQSRPAFAPIFPNQYSISSWANKVPIKDEVVPRKEKRQYKKRKHKASSSVCGVGSSITTRLDGYLAAQGSSEEETSSTGMRAASPMQPTQEAEDEDEGPFAFRRNPACNYHAPLPGGFGNWPWSSREDGGSGDRRYRYCLTSINRPKPRCVGFARRRRGRGGRVILDREPTQLDDIWRSLDFTVLDSQSSATTSSIESAATTSTSASTSSASSSSATLHTNHQLLNEIKNEWLHFRPKMSPKQDKEDADMDDGVLEGLADDCLLDRHGSVAIEVESMAIDDDPCPISTVVELDLDQLNSEDLFPALGDLSCLVPDAPDDSTCKSGKESSSSPVRTIDRDGGNGFIEEPTPSVQRRPHLDSVSHTPDETSTLSALLSSPKKAEKDLVKKDGLRTEPLVTPSRQEFLKGSLELNGPSVDLELCGENGDIRPCSPTQVGCSAFFMCDSSSASGGRISQSNGDSLPAKSVVVSRHNPPPSYPSTSLNQHRVTGNGSWNHNDVSTKSSGSVVVLNHSEGVNSSGVKVHRPAAVPAVLLSNGPHPSATAAECSNISSSSVSIRPTAVSRKITLVQQARTVNTTGPAPLTVQPSCSTSTVPVTSTLTQVAVPPTVTQKHTSRENMLNSGETSDEMCSDQKQLVHESNSLPMEVT